jgi:hypothetical protein
VHGDRAAKDNGTLQYEIYINDDQSECIVVERYKNSDALIEHLTNLGDIGEAILATGSVSGELLEALSEELKAILAGSPVGLFTRFASMRTLTPTENPNCGERTSPWRS